MKCDIRKMSHKVNCHKILCVTKDVSQKMNYHKRRNVAKGKMTQKMKCNTQ